VKVFGFHVDSPGNIGQLGQMHNYNRDEKPSERERGATTYWLSHRPLKVCPSTGRANSANSATSSEGSQVLLG